MDVGAWEEILPDWQNVMYIIFHSMSYILQTDSIPFTPGHGSFVTNDYGTADGVNSVSLMTKCIGK